jgi:hypothetical protein
LRGYSNADCDNVSGGGSCDGGCTEGNADYADHKHTFKMKLEVEGEEAKKKMGRRGQNKRERK